MKFSKILVFASSLLLVSSFEVPTVTLDELLQPSRATLLKIEDAVTQAGFFAVLQSQEQAQDKVGALKELVSCIHSGAAGKHAQVVELEDRTLRSTLATSTNQTVAHGFEESLEKRCPSFVTLAQKVRSASAAVGEAYARILDMLEQKDVTTTNGPFGKAVSMSENLEHFHLYWRPEERQDDTPTLSLHTDLGMFIVMTPPQYFQLAAPSAVDQDVDSGFQVRLPNGETVTPNFPQGSLVVMNGEGCADWVPSKLAKAMFVPPHQVVVPRGTVGLGRAWYGRMYLPSRNSMKQDEVKPVTFHQYWTDASAALIQAPSGASLVGHRLLLEQGNCSAGELYCWMKCMKTTNVTGCPTANVECKDPTTGQIWQGGNTHCMGCKLVCKSSGVFASIPQFSLLALLLSVAVLLQF